MATDALVTFLLPAIHKTGSVDLYGSWDNFSIAYPMQKDRQKGHGHWYGCHAFKSIICDGDPANCSMPRDGGLRMGGTYWYYYKRDGHVDFHDSSQPTTTACPLLPGQTVNVLAMPDLVYSALLSPQLAQSTIPVLTMDPALRDLTPQPPRKRERASVTQRPAHKSSASRDFWFSKSIGRLHTAVAETLITGFQGTSVFDDSCQRAIFLPGRRLRTAIAASDQRPGRFPHLPEELARPLTPLPDTVISSPDITNPLVAMRPRPTSASVAQLRSFENPFLSNAGHLGNLKRSHTVQGPHRSEAHPVDSLTGTLVGDDEVVRAISAPAHRLGYSERSTESRSYVQCPGPYGHSRCDRDKTARRNAQFLSEARTPPKHHAVATQSTQADDSHDEFRDSFIEDSRLPSAIASLGIENPIGETGPTNHPDSPRSPSIFELPSLDVKLSSFGLVHDRTATDGFPGSARNIWTPAPTSPSEDMNMIKPFDSSHWSKAVQSATRTPISPISPETSFHWGSPELHIQKDKVQEPDGDIYRPEASIFESQETKSETSMVGLSDPRIVLPVSKDFGEATARTVPNTVSCPPAPMRPPPPPPPPAVITHRLKLSLEIPGRGMGDFGDLDYLGAAIV